MKIRSWISTCSSAISTATATTKTQIPPPKLLISDSSTSSSSTSQDTNYSSLQSNLSLQTLPSVPSLQKLSPENLNLSVTHLPLAPIKPRLAPITALAIHHHLLYAASSHQINVFNLQNESHTLIDTFNTNNSSSGSTKSISFFNEKIFTSHQDSKIRVWQYSTETKTHKLLATLPTITDQLRNFILPKNYVKVRRHKKRLWIQHNDAVSGLAVSIQNLVFSVSWDKYMKIWEGSDFRCVESIKAHDDAINAVVVAGDGTVYTGSADRSIKVWARPVGERRYGMVARLEKHMSAVNALALNGDGSVLFSGACDRSILVWEREDSANHMVVTGALRGHGKAILCLINECDLLFSGSADRTVRIWQRGIDGRFCCLTVLDGHEKPVRSLVAVPGGGEPGGSVKVFTGSFDGEIKVWQVVVSSLNGTWNL